MKYLLFQVKIYFIQSKNMTKNLKSRKTAKDNKIKDEIQEPMIFGNEVQYPANAFWQMPTENEFNYIAPKKKKHTKTETPHYHGHRKRLRDRFAESNGDAIADYELLELILYRTIIRADAKPLAKNLLEHFGSLFEVFSASIENLLKVKNCGPAIATDLKIIFKLFEHITLAKSKEPQTIFTSWESFVTHCRIKLSNKKQELLYLLFLNKRNGLIKSEIQQTGTIDQAVIYPREVIKRALELGASGIVLAHNHPSGNPEPSTADIEVTLKLCKAAEPFGIIIHDHLIIGEKEFTSLKQSGFI